MISDLPNFDHYLISDIWKQAVVYKDARPKRTVVIKTITSSSPPIELENDEMISFNPSDEKDTVITNGKNKDTIRISGDNDDESEKGTTPINVEKYRDTRRSDDDESESEKELSNNGVDVDNDNDIITLEDYNSDSGADSASITESDDDDDMNIILDDENQEKRDNPPKPAKFKAPSVASKQPTKNRRRRK